MNKTSLSGLVVLIAAALTIGVMWDFSTMTPNTIGREETRALRMIGLIAIVVVTVIMSFGSGIGPKPPRHP